MPFILSQIKHLFVRIWSDLQTLQEVKLQQLVLLIQVIIMLIFRENKQSTCDDGTMEVCFQKLLLDELWIAVKTQHDIWDLIYSKGKEDKRASVSNWWGMSGFRSVELQTDVPCWFQSTAEVSNVLSPEFMQRQEQLVSTMIMIETVKRQGQQNNCFVLWLQSFWQEHFAAVMYILVVSSGCRFLTNLWCSGLIWKIFIALFCRAFSPLALFVFLLDLSFLGLE